MAQYSDLALYLAQGSPSLLLNLTTSIGTGAVLFIGISQILSGNSEFCYIINNPPFKIINIYLDYVLG